MYNEYQPSLLLAPYIDKYRGLKAIGETSCIGVLKDGRRV
jgi:hypothetical protein